MSANLSPEYKSAEAAFKKARDARERLDCLREMLRTIPKHKGTERLQADIKTRIKNLTDDLTAPKKGAGRRGPTHVVRPEGAAQIALIGAPNAGKSSLHARLTGSHAEVGPYPFTTSEPLPGMLTHENVHLQLVDLPPLSAEHPLPWIANALQPADGCMLIVDVQEPDCVERVEVIRSQLADRRVTLLPDIQEAADEDPFAIRLPTLLVASKADRSADAAGEIAVLQELLGTHFTALPVSATSGEGLDQIGPWWLETLGVVRVYTKAPGQAADLTRPFTLRRGDTVADVAQRVHRDLAVQLKYARLWGSGHFQGQQVGRDHPISDGDILELHE